METFSLLDKTSISRYLLSVALNEPISEENRNGKEKKRKPKQNKTKNNRLTGTLIVIQSRNRQCCEFKLPTCCSVFESLLLNSKHQIRTVEVLKFLSFYF